MSAADFRPGGRVVYRPMFGPCEYGLPGSTSKATDPERLEHVNPARGAR